MQPAGPGRPYDPEVGNSTEQPYVLILEGLISPPMAYRRMRRRLLDRGASGVDLGPVHVHDWIRAGLTGFGALQARTARTIERAHERAGGRPIMVVGHSGGGVLARLAMSDASYRGQVTAAAPLVACLVTLGTPHSLHESPTRTRHAGVQLSEFLSSRNPGAWFAPATSYVTIASDAVRPRPIGEPAPRRDPLDQVRRSFFRRIVGPLLPSGSDGVVSVEWAHLPGGVNLTYHDVLHGVIGGPWYGDADIIDRWWPVALAAWRDALLARAHLAVVPAPAPRSVTAVGGLGQPLQGLELP